MALPVRISAVPAAISRDIASAYQYGVLYGILLALALYNFVLYTSIRQAEFGLYSLYLLGFVANSLSYTGQIHTVITPDWGPYFQDWTDIFLMITYSVLGLHFARLVLNTKRYAPRLNRATIWIASAIPIGMLIGALINELVFAMILAFILNSSFAVLFVILGYHAYKNHVPSARLFFVASVTAATCICVSTMSVAGLLPYNDFTFKAIEVGMTFEAILLALLLAQRFREAEKDKVIAENLARTDDITQLLNRHGFTHRAFDEWRACQFSKHDGSFLLIEVDKFTHLTQKYGTATSELILSTLAKQLSKRLDGTATLARWSSEIFIAFLPRTNQLQAMLIAEELRHLIANQSIPYGGEFLQVTASIGVAGSNLLYFNGVPHNQYDLHEMIASAKDALYQAKMAGRDQIFASHLAPKV